METIPCRPKKQKRPLKWNMIGMLALVWLLPLTLASSVMFFFVSDKLKNHMKESIIISGEKAVEICEMRFSDAVGASRNASYLNVIRDAYEQYLESTEYSAQKNVQLYNTVTKFLSDQYRYNTSFLTTMLYFNLYPEKIFYTYSNRNQGTFDRVRVFEEKARDQVREGVKSLDTGLLFLAVDDNFYMARNMMTQQFEPFAVLVMEFDKTAMFKSLENIMGCRGYEIYVDGRLVAESKSTSGGKLYTLYQKEKDKEKKIYGFGGENCYLHDKIRFEGHDMEFLIALDSKSILSEQNFIPYLVLIFLVSMIPLILLVLWFFHREVNRPVNCLVEAAGEIERGNLGYTMPQIGSSRELAYLGESFNQMSTELKHQFDTIYSEELALRDAKIKALQSQINPHFLNNTLEIINWEARMNGNYKVSGMIESLSTMLEATLNRSKAPYIPLAEELNYMDAYLYIVARRFEDKLEIHKEIDESLLNVRVPRLIIQPIVENAVEHGVDDQNRIIIDIRLGTSDEKHLQIQIRNHGILSKDDEEKIQKLLGGEVEQGERSLNLGIRNVNQRLKIIYGGACGLTICSTEDGYTVSTLTLLQHIPEEEKRE